MPPAQLANRLPTALLLSSRWVLLWTSSTHLTVNSDKRMDHTMVLLQTECPGPFLTSVAILLVPLIGAIKDLLLRHNNSPHVDLLVVGLLLSPENYTRLLTRYLNWFESAFLSILHFIAIKNQQTCPSQAQGSCPESWHCHPTARERRWYRSPLSVACTL